MREEKRKGEDYGNKKRVINRVEREKQKNITIPQYYWKMAAQQKEKIGLNNIRKKQIRNVLTTTKTASQKVTQSYININITQTFQSIGGDLALTLKDPRISRNKDSKVEGTLPKQPLPI